MDVNGSFGSCWLAVWWNVLGKQATSSSWVAEVLVFCRSPVGEKSVLVNFGLPHSICGIGYKFHLRITTRFDLNPGPGIFEKNATRQIISLDKNRPYIPLLTELPEVSWLAGCQHSAVLTSWIGCGEQVWEMKHLWLESHARKGCWESTWSRCVPNTEWGICFCHVQFCFRLFSKNNIQLGHKDSRNKQFSTDYQQWRSSPLCF